MPFEAFKPVFKALPKLGFVGLAPALVITQCPKTQNDNNIFQFWHFLFTSVWCDDREEWLRRVAEEIIFKEIFLKLGWKELNATNKAKLFEENRSKDQAQTVIEVLMKAEAEQTSSISSGWNREPLKKHPIKMLEFDIDADVAIPFELACVT